MFWNNWNINVSILLFLALTRISTQAFAQDGSNIEIEVTASRPLNFLLIEIQYWNNQDTIQSIYRLSEFDICQGLLSVKMSSTEKVSLNQRDFVITPCNFVSKIKEFELNEYNNIELHPGQKFRDVLVFFSMENRGIPEGKYKIVCKLNIDKELLLNPKTNLLYSFELSSAEISW